MDFTSSIVSKMVSKMVSRLGIIMQTFTYSKKKTKKTKMAFNNDLEYAVRKGDNRLIDSLLKEGRANVNCGLEYACKYGRLDLVQLMIDKGANNWDNALAAACGHNHKELAQLMINMGATNYNQGLLRACEGGHLDLVQMMIDNGANNWNSGLCGACRGGHNEIVLLMISKGANHFNTGLNAACVNKHNELIVMMISMGATTFEYLFYSNIDVKVFRRVFYLLQPTLRQEFVNKLKDRLRERVTYINLRPFAERNYYYMVNRHCIKLNENRERFWNLLQKGTTCNTILQFACDDVAKFTARFVGVNAGIQWVNS